MCLFIVIPEGNLRLSLLYTCMEDALVVLGRQPICLSTLIFGLAAEKVHRLGENSQV